MCTKKEGGNKTTPSPLLQESLVFVVLSLKHPHTHTHIHTHDGFLQGLHTAHTTLQRNSGPTPFLFIFSLPPPSLPYVVFFKLVETLTTLILSSFALFHAFTNPSNPFLIVKERANGRG